MSYVKKYQYSFVSFDGVDCRVEFYINDPATNDLTILNPGVRPFVLREFNSDQDFFKPIRPFIAEMEILSNNVSMDDFITNADDGVKVQFYYNNVLFWAGWLMQDDFQENWIDTNHFITLRATDGLGTIKNDPPTTFVGLNPVIDYIGDALNNTTLKFLDRYVVCNLFYDGMSDRGDGEYNPLDSAQLDGRTFEGDTKDKIIEKIMRAWSMTVYQWYGRWFVARLEEWLNNNQIYGLIEENLVPDTAFNNDYEVNIGVDENIKPIMPEMLRSIRRPSKRTKITFFYKFPNEIICNQDFRNGTFDSTEAAGGGFPERKLYSVDCWTLHKGTPNVPNDPETGDYFRIDELNDNAEVTDSYLELRYNASPHYVEAETFGINKGDFLKINFEYRMYNEFSNGLVVRPGWAVKLEGDLLTYWLTADLTWSTTYEELNVDWIPGTTANDWTAINQEDFLKCKATPEAGDVTFYFFNAMYETDAHFNVKNIKIEIEEANKKPGVIGDYDQYEGTDNIFNDFTEETFIDDSDNRQHKGALHFSGALTGDNWYRYDYPSERLTFKRQKAIAHMYLNQRYRQKLEVNMLGNSWLDGATLRPIWLQNKFVFVDDATGKKWMITNLSEMDFSTTQWKANLIEVWDSTDDPEVYQTHSFANIYEKDV